MSRKLGKEKAAMKRAAAIFLMAAILAAVAAAMLPATSSDQPCAPCLRAALLFF
jgi:hypothetical protein